jgi:hypothetical protein
MRFAKYQQSAEKQKWHKSLVLFDFLARLIKKAALSLRWWRHHVDIIQIIKKQAAIKKESGGRVRFLFCCGRILLFRHTGCCWRSMHLVHR